MLSLQPFVPSGKDFAKSRALFRALGFEERWANDGYVGFACGAASFILQDIDMPDVAAQMMIRVDVVDLDEWWRANENALASAGVTAKPPHDFPWGREVHFIDYAGVCWHVGV